MWHRGRGLGVSRSGRLADLWEWDGSNWIERIPPQSPSARMDHQMVQEPERSRIVLFGGQTGVPNLFDTWLYGTSVLLSSTP